MGVIQKQKIAAFGSSYTVFVGAAEGCDLLIFCRSEPARESGGSANIDID
jgi:hypothetical protein